MILQKTTCRKYTVISDIEAPPAHNFINLNIESFTAMVFIQSWEGNNISVAEAWGMKLQTWISNSLQDPLQPPILAW